MNALLFMFAITGQELVFTVLVISILVLLICLALPVADLWKRIGAGVAFICLLIWALFHWFG